VRTFNPHCYAVQKVGLPNLEVKAQFVHNYSYSRRPWAYRGRLPIKILSTKGSVGLEIHIKLKERPTHPPQPPPWISFSRHSPNWRLLKKFHLLSREGKKSPDWRVGLYFYPPILNSTRIWRVGEWLSAPLPQTSPLFLPQYFRGDKSQWLMMLNFFFVQRQQPLSSPPFKQTSEKKK
jgi:hypothetical protein